MLSNLSKHVLRYYVGKICPITVYSYKQMAIFQSIHDVCT